MDTKFQAILDSLPPKLPRSKLEPYADLIRELRKRERSYREIAGLLKERCGLNVGVHTLYSFVRTRGIGEGDGRIAEPGGNRCPCVRQHGPAPPVAIGACEKSALNISV